MAEWVQKGNLKGPQGDPGQDAQLPEGGTTGQVLTKTADGEAWQDAPEPDLSGFVKIGSVNQFTNSGDAELTQVQVKTGSSGNYARLVSLESGGSVVAGTGNDYISIRSDGNGQSVKVRHGSVEKDYEISDLVQDDVDTIATGKAVADYHDSHGVTYPEQATGQTYAEDVLAASKTASTAPVVRVAGEGTYGVVKTASMADFKAYMGIS